MKPPKALILTPVGRNNSGDLVVHVRLRRRSMYAFRLLYRSARAHGLNPLRSLRLSLGVVLASGADTP